MPISRTFQDLHKNSITFQAWKAILLNSRAFKDLNEPCDEYFKRLIEDTDASEFSNKTVITREVSALPIAACLT